MSHQSFPLGQPLVVDATFSVAGVPTDPTAITFRIREPDGDILQYTWPPNGVIVKISNGVFQGQATPTKLGMHGYRMIATGTAAGVIEDTFLVSTVIDGPLQIIVTPDDYEGIRMVLGVTDLDVPNSVIDTRPFGPVGEALVQSEVDDWAAVKAIIYGNTVPTAATLIRWQFLVAATQYVIASLIANTMARGGFVGLVRGEGQRDSSAWAKYAGELWGLGQTYLGQATVLDPNLEELFGFGFPIMITAGPTKKRERSSAWAPNNWRWRGY